MATKSSGAVRLMRVSAHEAMGAVLAEIAVLTAAEILRAGYPRATPDELREIASTATRSALMIPHLVEDLAAASDEALESAARDLGALVVRDRLGPAPMAH